MLRLLRFGQDDNSGSLPPYRLSYLPPYHLTDRQLRPPSILRYSDISSSTISWCRLRSSLAVWAKPPATSTVSLTRIQLAAYSSPFGTSTTSHPRNASCRATAYQSRSRRPPSQEIPVLWWSMPGNFRISTRLDPKPRFSSHAAS